MTVTTRRRLALALGVAGLCGLAGTSAATAVVEKQARDAGVKIGGCLDCHASPHAQQEMARRARAAGFDPHNCLGCHGSKLEAKLSDLSKLSDRGKWLLAEREKRGAKEVDGAWLKEYAPPSPAPKN
jgi:hypothetical protein